jgi:uroporphyrinogen III methyltransferase/synthase
MTELGLSGRTILVTRPRGQTGRIAAAFAAEGAKVIEAPAIQIEPPTSWEEIDRAISSGGYDWVVFTSVNGVRFFWERLIQAGNGPNWFRSSRVAAIGPETARFLEEKGVRPNLVPDEFVAEALIACLADAEPLQDRRVLLPRADIARQALEVGLRAQGAIVDQVVAYRTVHAEAPASLIEQLRSGQIDAVTFTSSSTVRGLLEMLGSELDALDRITLACIGPITAATAREAGLEPDVVADVYTAAGLVAALKAFYSRSAEPVR